MQKTLRETCPQYVARRLSEGWKITKQEGFLIILESPDGIIRPVDLRNDVETLRPNAAGDLTEIQYQYPASGSHYEKVDEESADDESTYVYAYSTALQRDLYNLPASSGSGTINFIKVYFRCMRGGIGAGQNARPVIKSDTTVTEGTSLLPSRYSYTTYSQQWNTNPADSQAWAWADIDALQIGVKLYAISSTYFIHCTQVYVEVDYSVITAPTVTTQDASGIGFD